MLDEYMMAPIANYEHEYEVDTLGNVFSLRRKKQLKAADYGSKYLQVSLCRNGKFTRFNRGWTAERALSTPVKNRG